MYEIVLSFKVSLFIQFVVENSVEEGLTLPINISSTKPLEHLVYSFHLFTPCVCGMPEVSA